MESADIRAQKQFLFGNFFILANQLQVICDRMFNGYGLTTKQWLLTVVIEKFGDTPPTLNEVSEVMGSSHQNVKQIALKLQEKEFLRIEKDTEDNRAIRLKLTEKSDAFWQNRQSEDERFVTNLFADLSTEEVEIMLRGINKLYRTMGVRIKKMIKDNSVQKRKEES